MINTRKLLCFLVVPAATASRIPPEFLADPVEGTSFHIDQNQRIVDEFGRQRFFHGTNIVYKTFPFHPSTSVFDAKHSFVEEDMQLLYELGLNSIRLGCAWAGMEPVKGSYNESWFDTVQGIVNLAGKYGIYSLLDHHQDAYSTQVCGTGFPSWTVANTDDKWLYRTFLGKRAKFPAPLAQSFELRGLGPVELSLGVPNKTLCWNFTTHVYDDFPLLHASFQTALSYEEMYDNVDGKLDAWTAFWTEIAKRTGGNKRVLGYELSNEPFAGDFYSHPWNMLPWLADRDRLQGVFDRLAKAIRDVAADPLIFFESVTWEVTGLGERYGFSHAPGGPEFANRSVLSFHNSVDGQLAPDPKYYAWREAEAKRLGVAAVVTETGDGEDILHLADDSSTSSIAGWMNWDYKLFADWTWDNCGLFQSDCQGGLTSCLQVSEAQRFSRVYPQAVAGKLRSFSFNSTTGDAHVSWMVDFSIQAPTVIFIPKKWHYPSGYSLSVEPTGSLKWTTASEGSYVSFTPSTTPPKQDLIVTVNVRRGQLASVYV